MLSMSVHIPSSQHMDLISIFNVNFSYSCEISGSQGGAYEEDFLRHFAVSSRRNLPTIQRWVLLFNHQGDKALIVLTMMQAVRTSEASVNCLRDYTAQHPRRQLCSHLGLFFQEVSYQILQPFVITVILLNMLA
jgi:hypothetical protein